ncbi:DUF262 domain-containing protein [Maribellus sp. YY47]|uniref:DUF262 domain-containing protein n=1 Tax=Maribellus sp. YY47 TaxID=2929486 RepID=UPI002000B917|nr:DUF262 domain-containing protein [Maribellus sp. YY47]MCK3686174.1 DUF262 domain-containing protein [Maribellus sp. YY47]
MTNFKTKPVCELNAHHFYIDEYQRGYKWTSVQILDLLNDLTAYDRSKENFYCLQPLAVKIMDEERREKHFGAEASNCFEVIDGQQRLTTIFLILKTLGKELYQISYQTRESSAEFLKSINEKIGELSFPFSFNGKNYEQAVKELNQIILKKWKTTFDKTDFDNIDNYHFFAAYLTIKAWFADKNDDFNADFVTKLLNDTHFIWYIDASEADAKKVFRNLNSGKIGLTNAELIKALFINNHQHPNKEIQELQQNTFANEWDEIEQTLQNDDFWFFINNSTDASKYQTRIDFLFDIVTQKPSSEKDKLYTYRWYANDASRLDWKLVKNHFLKLREWYNNRSWYHLIGYIIDRRFATIKELIDLSQVNSDGKRISKSAFDKKLYDIIRKKFKKEKQNRASHDLELITFEDDYDEVKNVLLLFNIEQYQRNVPGFRFPFKAFKSTRWTIEHIHAQNADDIESVGELQAFISDVATIYEEIETRTKQLNNLKQEREKHNQTFEHIGELSALEEKKSDYNKDIAPKLAKLSEELRNIADSETLNDELKNIRNEVMTFTKEFLDVHKLGNLALLDGSTNSGLGKRPFKQKRDYILGVDEQPWTASSNKTESKEKRYIPPATVQVFLKYHTREVEQWDLWGYKDRTNYLGVIKNTLKRYFEEEEVYHV